MSTKKSEGKLQGKQSAREKMRFDSTPVAAYEQMNKQEHQQKMQHRLRPKKLNVALAAGYGPDNLESK